MIDPKDKQIRERLIARGVSSLDDAELLSILLGDSSNGVAVVDRASGLLSDGGLSLLSRMELSRLRMAGGIGVSCAARIAVAFELGRRVAKEQGDVVEYIQGDADVVRIFKPRIAELPYEEFWVLFLSSSNRILDRVRVSQGGVSETVVDHKLIVKRALELLCSAIIVVHNHPSGEATPSDNDLDLTVRLSSAAALFDIALLDHIIISRSNHFSFRRNNSLPDVIR